MITNEQGQRRDFWTILLVAVFIAVVFMTGGSSRPDAQSQIVIRLVSVVFISIAVARVRIAELARVRFPLGLLIALAGLMAIQLIPLPAVLWKALPGYAPFADQLAVAGLDRIWRPLSLVPDLTLNSLASLLPPLAAILLIAPAPAFRQRSVLSLLIILILVAGILGVIQIASGASSTYLYRITNYGAATGVFANRNHQGMLLAMALPMMAVLAVAGDKSKANLNWRGRFALIAAVFLLPLILVTGSRAGLILALIGVGAGWLLYANSARSAVQISANSSRFSWIVALVGVLVVGLVAISSRAQSIQRLFNEDVSQEIRLKLFLPMLEMGWTYFPFGTGFGSFVDLFKYHERVEDLRLAYLNHAHNDLMELYIEGGFPALILLAVFVGWAIRLLVLSWSKAPVDRDAALFARLGSVLIVMLLLASLADYPLRTPIMMVVFAIACCWMGRFDALLRRRKA